jgi:hypothetical protein
MHRTPGIRKGQRGCSRRRHPPPIFYHIIQIHFYLIRLFHDQENLIKQRLWEANQEEKKYPCLTNPKQEKDFVPPDPKVQSTNEAHYVMHRTPSVHTCRRRMQERPTPATPATPTKLCAIIMVMVEGV